MHGGSLGCLRLNDVAVDTCLSSLLSRTKGRSGPACPPAEEGAQGYRADNRACNNVSSHTIRQVVCTLKNHHIKQPHTNETTIPRLPPSGQGTKEEYKEAITQLTSIPIVIAAMSPLSYRQLQFRILDRSLRVPPVAAHGPTHTASPEPSEPSMRIQ